MLDQLLAGVASSRRFEYPFVHLVFDQVVEQKTFWELNRELPEDIPFLHAIHILSRGSSLWRTYVQALNSATFHRAILQKLGVELDFFDSDIGLRKRDFFSKYVSESYIAIRQPNSEGWLLPPHVDSHFAMTSMVQFFRDEGDKDDSGPLLLLQKNGQKIEDLEGDSIIEYFDPGGFEVIREIPYVSNRGACFLSSESAWHGIGPRLMNRRRSLNISLELQNNGNRRR